MDQSEFTRIFCERPQSFAWFLGAGASRNANLPTAEDIITDLKRRYYCSEENQEFSVKDLQNTAVRETVEAYMTSRGFPERGTPQEYSTYFETIFGDDKERQRRYIAAMLSEEGVRLSIGNRVFGALMSGGLCRLAFTTNFDPVVEKSVAEIGSRSLAAFHLEGAHNANAALNNEEYPIYCKLHGDFRYDSIKNLSADLASQNNDLSRCLINAANRFGFVVAGYSGRDESVMSLFQEALASQNRFPHGLYWMTMKGVAPLASVTALIEAARENGVAAHLVEIETYDGVMLRLWRNLTAPPEGMDIKVRKGRAATVSVPLPSSDGDKPLIRFNALPIISVPNSCVQVSLRNNPTWEDIKSAQRESNGNFILTLDENVMAWGSADEIKSAFGDKYSGLQKMEFDPDWRQSGRLHIKRFLEDGLGKAFARNRPLLMRRRRSSAYLIVDHKAQDVGILAGLHDECGKVTGQISGLSVEKTDKHDSVDKVFFAEAIKFSLAYGDDRLWLLLRPDVWVWPDFAREHASQWLNERKHDRLNNKHDRLLSAWISLLSDTAEKNAEVQLPAFTGDADYANPSFGFVTRTGYSMKRKR